MYKRYEMDKVKIEEEIYNYKSNIELRTSQLIRLKTESIRQSSGRADSSTKMNEVAKESIFSNNNYGVSTITQTPKAANNQERPVNSVPAKPNRGSTGGPKVKTKKGYCTLI